MGHWYLPPKDYIGFSIIIGVPEYWEFLVKTTATVTKLQWLWVSYS